MDRLQLPQNINDLRIVKGVALTTIIIITTSISCVLFFTNKANNDLNTISTNLKYSIEMNADRCENFYAHICGSNSKHSTNTIARSYMIKSIKNRLMNKMDDESGATISEARNLFDSCQKTGKLIYIHLIQQTIKL